jgi:hypothetical protein
MTALSVLWCAEESLEPHISYEIYLFSLRSGSQRTVVKKRVNKEENSETFS